MGRMSLRAMRDSCVIAEKRRGMGGRACIHRKRRDLSISRQTKF